MKKKTALYLIGMLCLVMILTAACAKQPAADGLSEEEDALQTELNEDEEILRAELEAQEAEYERRLEENRGLAELVEDGELEALQKIEWNPEEEGAASLEWLVGTLNKKVDGATVGAKCSVRFDDGGSMGLIEGAGQFELVQVTGTLPTIASWTPYDLGDGTLFITFTTTSGTAESFVFYYE